MMKLNKRSLVLLIAVTLLLTFTVSGTVAFLAAGTDPVTNVFTPVEVDTFIDEDVSVGSKSEIKVINKETDKTIPVYVRVAVAGNWVDEAGNIVAPWDDDAITISSAWQKSGEYYYYTYVLPVGATTPNLLATAITDAGMPVGAHHLEVTVVHQSIQATPKDAAKAVWGETAAGLLSDNVAPATN